MNIHSRQFLSFDDLFAGIIDSTQMFECFIDSGYDFGEGGRHLIPFSEVMEQIFGGVELDESLNLLPERFLEQTRERSSSFVLESYLKFCKDGGFLEDDRDFDDEWETLRTSFHSALVQMRTENVHPKSMLVDMLD